MPSRRRDRTEVSCVIKYLVFGFNVIFWIVGIVIFIMGIWAWTEKDTFSNLSHVAQVPLDPALIFIIVGFIIYIIGFLGCVGALRENTVLLFVFNGCLSVIFLMQMTAGILAFVYKDWMSKQIDIQLKNMIVNYREDIDMQNVIDWVQADWLKCCGVENMQDWDSNMYFNCSGPATSVERCGVPFSCCKPKSEEILKDTQCGFGVRVTGNTKRNIYDKGCLESAKFWMNHNLVPIAGVVVAVALLQIFGMCFSQNLRNDILAQKAKWGH
ncbi:Tetraspanin-5 [Lamellibrachia satsuma]|nr:Tetraspanin-5 [Lamellibrachia satsuma]